MATADAKACAMNANKAWVDVALLIDNSANMGASNLRKVGGKMKNGVFLCEESI